MGEGPINNQPQTAAGEGWGLEAGHKGIELTFKGGCWKGGARGEEDKEVGG
jgi:hypothetical protein